MDHFLPYSQDIENRLAEMERRMSESIQQVRDHVSTLDQRVTSYRSRRFLEQVSSFYPKSDTVVFIGNRNFGNTKYAYLSFCDYAKDKGITYTSVTGDVRYHEALKKVNLPCLPYAQDDWTEDDIKTLLSAKVVVIDDLYINPDWHKFVPAALIHGAKIVMLWHGITIKKIALENLRGLTTVPWHTEVAAACGNYEVLIGNSAASREEWAQYFSFRTFAPIGFPRNDVLLRDMTENDCINVDCEILSKVQEAARNKNPVILYAPTWRDYVVSSWLKAIDIGQVAEHCRMRGYVFCINLHPIEQGNIEEFRNRYPQINFVEPSSDIYPIMKYADVVVTDYSSIAFDFVLLDRPLVFFRPDHTEYVEKSRQLIEGHEDYICGEVVNSELHLTYAIELAIECRRAPAADPFREKRQALRKKLFDHHDAGACGRLNELIETLLEAPE